MIVTGGLAWWNDFIVLACYNISDRQEEVCFCSLRSNKFLYFKDIKHYLRTLQMAQTVNNLPAKDPLEKKLTTHYNTLTWKSHGQRQATVRGVTKS